MRLLVRHVRAAFVIAVVAMFHAAPAIAKAKLDSEIEQTVTTRAGGTVEVIVHPKAGTPTASAVRWIAADNCAHGIN